MDKPPSLADLTHSIAVMDHQCTTILVISAINLLANVITVVVGLLIAAA